MSKRKPPTPRPLVDPPDWPREPTEVESAIIRDLMASDEPMSDIAARYGLTRARVQQIRRKLAQSGEDVPVRRPGRPGRPSGNAANPTSVGGRIAAMRLDRGLTQRDLAARMVPPTTQPTLGQVENAGDDVAPEMVVRIAKALGCDPTELDGRLPPKVAMSLVRVMGDGAVGGVVAGPEGGPRWEPLRDADRAKFDAMWEGAGPSSDRLGELVDRAAEDGVAVVLRGDLPVRTESTGTTTGDDR